MRPAALVQHIALALAVALCGLAGAAQAEIRTLRWAHQNELESLDPMAIDDPFTRGVQGWFYEALSGLDQDLKLLPVLAESWDNPEPTKWIFHLRKDVSFHDGSPFTADDVIFSWQRSLTAGSAIKDVGAKAAEVNRIDDHTVEVITLRHNPVLPRDWSLLPIMSRRWAQQKQTEAIASSHASLHENGTGPFMVIKRKPKTQTTFERYKDYWNKDMPGNVAKVVFRPMPQVSARIAALLAGDVDIAMPVPLQSVPQLENEPGVHIMRKPQARVLFISMNQRHDTLPHSSIREKNPLKDKRVRQAISLAIDTQAINQSIMGGWAKPTGTIIAPQVNGYDVSFSKLHAFDIERAKKLMLDAGYSDSFSIRLACPNGRYVNDQAICQAIMQMLARINIRVELSDQAPAAAITHDSPVAAQDTGLYLQSWAPASMDAASVLHTLVSCRGGASGAGWLNRSGYCNQEIDALALKIGFEADQVRRNIMIREAFSMLRNDYSYLPLHQPPMLWGVRTDITLTQRADNVLDIRSVVMP